MISGIGKILAGNKTDLAIIAILFILARGLTLVNDGVYWDDWTTYNCKGEVIQNTFMERGTPLKGIMHSYLKDSPIAYRLLSFISLLSVSIILFLIISTIKEVEPADRFFIVTLFALFPVNFAAVSLAITPYLLCLFLFSLGSLFLVFYLSGRKAIYQIVSLLLFFISFQYEALLIFYLVPFLLIIYHENIFKNLPGSLAGLKKYPAFILLPFVYWTLRQIFMQPYGFYAGLNKVELRYIILAPINAIESVFNNLFFPFIQFFLEQDAGLKFSAFFLILAIFLYNYLKKRVSLPESKAGIKIFFLGVLIYFLGVFPFLAVGRNGFYFGNGWGSRDQLLVPLGAALIFIYGSKIVFEEFGLNRRILALFLSFLIVFSVSANIINCLVFQRHWFKQLSLISVFKNSSIVHDNTTFLVDDQALSLNPFGKPLLFFEYTGMMKYAFGDEKRFVLDINEFGNKETYPEIAREFERFLRYPEYNMSQYTFKLPEYIIRIKPSTKELSLRMSLKLLALKLIKREEFSKRLQGLVAVEYIPLPYSRAQ